MKQNYEKKKRIQLCHLLLHLLKSLRKPNNYFDLTWPALYFLKEFLLILQYINYFGYESKHQSEKKL